METVKTLISPETKQLAISRIQTVALKSIHDFFFEEGFEQLMPVILSPITDPLGPDPGSSVIKTAEIEYLGQRLCLTQSMILHKQIAIGKGIKKLYIVSPNVRLEGPAKQKTGIHAFEFSQVDFEILGAKMHDVFDLLELLMRKIKFDVKLHATKSLQILGREFPMWDAKFPVYTSHEMISKYGTDWELKASSVETTPFFVTCLKREFYDMQDRSREGEHFLNYDLYYPEGFLEALSGSEREYEYEHIKARIEKDGFCISSFQSYVDKAKDGLLFPSAGGGFGVERLIRYLTGVETIAEVQLFKRIPGIPVKV